MQLKSAVHSAESHKFGRVPAFVFVATLRSGSCGRMYGGRQQANLQIRRRNGRTSAHVIEMSH